MSSTKDLSKEPPRSPRERVGKYVILARAIDKCRADVEGVIGDYHTGCPLDHMLLDWKGVAYAPFRAEVIAGSSDEEIAEFLDDNGIEKSDDEVEAWSEKLEVYRPYEDVAKREWFVGECAPLGLDPKTTTLFDYLEADDRHMASHV